MTKRILGSDQMREVLDVVEAIVEKRGITRSHAIKEMGYNEMSGVYHWRAGYVSIGPAHLAKVAAWIRDWKHVLKKEGEG